MPLDKNQQAEHELRQLRARLEKSNLIQQSLFRITQLSSKTDSLEDFYRAIHSSIRELMYADNLFIALYDSENEIIKFVYYEDSEDNVEISELDDVPMNIARKTVTGYMLKTGKLCHKTMDEMKTMEQQGDIVLQGPPSNDWLGIPLKDNKKMVGALVVQSYIEGINYSKEDEEILEFVSVQVAHLLQRKQYEQELQTINHSLEERIKVRTKALQKAKEDAEFANQAKSEFLANVTHELRTPMHAILSFSDLGLKKNRDVPQDRIHSYFDKINQSGQRLLTFVNDLLDISKMESGNIDLALSLNNINPIIELSLLQFDSLLDESEVQIELDLDQKMVEIEFDKARISQVITNLVSNAIKFSKKGTSILITTKKESETSFNFSISDSGIGIPADEIENIFEKFTQSSLTQTGAGGTGLGLSICKQIVLLHQGKIWAENLKQGGAKFQFSISNEESSGAQT